MISSLPCCIFLTVYMSVSSAKLWVLKIRNDLKIIYVCVYVYLCLYPCTFWRKWCNGKEALRVEQQLGFMWKHLNILTLSNCDFLVVQSLRICLSVQGMWVQSLVREMRAHKQCSNEAHMPQLEILCACMMQRKITHAATKTQCSQINKYLRKILSSFPDDLRLCMWLERSSLIFLFRIIPSNITSPG